MSSGVYCKNIEHVELEDDGMVYCQHCYRELEALYYRLIAENNKYFRYIKELEGKIEAIKSTKQALEE